MTPPRPRALVFDLDGTLVDSRRDIAEAANATRVAFGREPIPDEQILAMVGDGARALVARVFELPLDDPDVDERLSTFRRIYEADPCRHATLLPGAREALAIGLPAALVTNKPRGITLLLLDGLGIAPAFGAVWGGDDGPLKPDPAGVAAVLATLGVPAAQAWMIGDGPQDVGAGKAAGCFTVAVPGIAERERLLASAPDHLIDSLAELPDLVASAR